MLFDTDVLIWAQRGSEKAMEVLSDAAERSVSIMTYMELIQGAGTRGEARTIKDFLEEGLFRILPLTENIGHRASVYVEEYSMPAGVWAVDGIIAATAVENAMVLVSGNAKHFKPIRELRFQLFRP